MGRQTSYVVLCEDKTQYTFVRRFLIGRGAHDRKFTPRYAPAGKVSGEQWVRDQFAAEVDALRRYPGTGRALVVMTDADTLSSAERCSALRDRLQTSNMPDVAEWERIGIFVAARNIETWILHVLEPDQRDLNEVQDYSLRRLPDGWQKQVERYAEHRQRKPDWAPGSFRDASAAYERIKP